MKAKFILAAALSSCVIYFPAHADTPKSPSMQKQASYKIDLNKADAATLTGSVKGIGKKRAEAIVAYRESHHGFKAVQELAEVKGLGQHFVEVNKDKLDEVFTLSNIE